MSYVNHGVGADPITFLVDAGAQATTASINAATGKYQKEERAAKNLEQAARLELQAVQSAARGVQEATRITAEGQVATAAARIEAERAAAKRRSKVIMYGALGVAGFLVLSFVGYRLTRNP